MQVFVCVLYACKFTIPLWFHSRWTPTRGSRWPHPICGLPYRCPIKFPVWGGHLMIIQSQHWICSHFVHPSIATLVAKQSASPSLLLAVSVAFLAWPLLFSIYECWHCHFTLVILICEAGLSPPEHKSQPHTYRVFLSFLFVQSHFSAATCEKVFFYGKTMFYKRFVSKCHQREVHAAVILL